MKTGVMVGAAAVGFGLTALAAADATTVAAASAGVAGAPSLTGRIVDALENAGPEMGARVNAVMDQVGSRLTTLMRTANDGTVTIQGGAGSRLRQVILNPDGTSVVRAFDASKNAWNVVREINPQ